MCDFDDSVTLGKFIGTIIVVGGGALPTCLSVLCLLVNKTIDSILQKIFISFQIGNLIGVCILLKSTVLTVCNDLSYNLSWEGSSVLLTLTHLILLLLVEQTILTSNVRKPLPSFSGLMCVYWLSTSIALGIWITMSTLNKHQSIACIVFSSVSLITIVGIIVPFFAVIKKKQWLLQQTLQHREKLIQRKHYKYKSLELRWNPRNLIIILVSYITCVFPCIIVQLYHGFENETRLRSVDFIASLIYSLHYFASAGVFMEMWYEQRGGRVSPYMLE